MSKIYLVHGWAYSLDRYQELIKLLKSRGLDVEILHVPGLTEPSKKAWTIDDYVTWLEGKLEGPKPIVIAHSNGGRITLKYLNKHPKNISKLVLIDSAGVPDLSTSKTLKRTVYKKVAKVGKFMAKVPLVKRTYYKLIGATDYYNAPPNMKKTMQNMLNADKDIDLKNISVPTTIIWGRNDTQTPIRDAYVLKEAIEGSKLDIIDDARHSPHSTHPQEVANIIYDFIN